MTGSEQGSVSVEMMTMLQRSNIASRLRQRTAAEVRVPLLCSRVREEEPVLEESLTLRRRRGQSNRGGRGVGRRLRGGSERQKGVVQPLRGVAQRRGGASQCREGAALFGRRLALPAVR